MQKKWEEESTFLLSSQSLYIYKTCIEPHMHFVLMFVSLDYVCIEISFGVVCLIERKEKGKFNEIKKLNEQKGKLQSCENCAFDVFSVVWSFTKEREDFKVNFHSAAVFFFVSSGVQ